MHNENAIWIKTEGEIHQYILKQEDIRFTSQELVAGCNQVTGKIGKNPLTSPKDRAKKQNKNFNNV